MALVSFSTSNATPETYRTFIDALRLRLTAGRPTSYGIPVLPPKEDVPDAQRFLLVNLTNSANNTITVAIDVVNAYVVGYSAGGRAYLLKENALENRPPTQLLFPGITPIQLGFDGTYGGLARAVNPNSNVNDNTSVLEQILLGRNELDRAIRLLSLAESQANQAVGFVVIIQMLSEAARFKQIEGLLRTTMRETYDPLVRTLAIKALQTNWSDLSEEIQRAEQRNERGFTRTIVLYTVGNERREVNSVDSPFVQGLAMLLYDAKGNSNPGAPRHDET